MTDMDLAFDQQQAQELDKTSSGQSPEVDLEHEGSEQGPDARARMTAMAQRFGLSLLEIDSFADLAPRLETICEGCTESGACRRAMAGEAPFPIAVCPNAGVYAVLAAE